MSMFWSSIVFKSRALAALLCLRLICRNDSDVERFWGFFGLEMIVEVDRWSH